jgi:hypothetical protein
MKKVFFLLGSFLTVSTLSLHVHAVQTEEELEIRNTSSDTEDQTQKTSHYLYLFGEEEDSFVPKKFTENNINELTKGKDAEKGASIAVGNKIISIDQKNAKILFQYGPSMPLEEKIHEKITFKSFKIIKEGNLENPQTIEAIYTIPKNVMQKSLTIFSGKPTEYDIKIRIQENDSFQKDDTRKFLGACITFFPKDTEIFQEIKEMVKNDEKIQDIAKSIGKDLKTKALNIYQDFINLKIDSESYDQFSKAANIISNKSTILFLPYHMDRNHLVSYDFAKYFNELLKNNLEDELANKKLSKIYSMLKDTTKINDIDFEEKIDAELKKIDAENNLSSEEEIKIEIEKIENVLKDTLINKQKNKELKAAYYQKRLEEISKELNDSKR